MPFHDVVPGIRPLASTLSGSTVWKNTVPLVGWVQNTWPSQVMSSPQVLPPRLLNCSKALPSGLKRTTPLPSRPKLFVPSGEVTDADAVAVRRVNPAVEPPAQVVDDGVRVGGAEAGVELRALVGDLVAVGVFEIPDVGRGRRDDAVPVEHEAGDELELVGEDVLAIHHAVAVGVRQDRDGVFRIAVLRAGCSDPLSFHGSVFGTLRPLGYSGVSETQSRPRSSQSMFIAFVISGSAATSVRSKSGCTSIFAAALAGAVGPPST